MSDFDPFKRPERPIDNLTPYKQGYKDGAIKATIFTAIVVTTIVSLFFSRKKK